MPCDPADNNLAPLIGPPIPIPGLGIPTVDLSPPLPGFNLPEFPEILDDLLERLRTLFPSGDFLSQIDNFGNDLLKLLSNVFSQIAPYLSLYNFFLALLNMVLCIIEVLCSLMNPFALFGALTRLFKRCFPNFIRIFPWLALLAMIIALLLLLLALIEYIIRRILQIIEDLLRNLRLLGDNTIFNDTDSAAAVAIKIASLLCIFENLFAVFTALGAIIAIVQALAGLQGRSTCGSLRGQGIISDDDVGCCPIAQCPPFVSERINGFVGTQGQFIYYKRLYPAPPAIDGWQDIFNESITLRPERWQFINKEENQLLPDQYPQNESEENSNYMLKSIITSLGLDIFWPSGNSYDEFTNIAKAPYRIDMTFRDLDPEPFFPNDTAGPRDFIIREAIIDVQPYVGTYNRLNVPDTSIDDGYGTVSLVGGKVYQLNPVLDETGTPTGEVTEVPYPSSSNQANLRTFFSQPAEVVEELPPDPEDDDGIYISDVEFALSINFESLVGYQLITLGCPPQIRIELDAVNAQFNDFRSTFDKLGGKVFPDLDSANQCLRDALTKLRQEVSEDAVETFREEVTKCLTDLEAETLEVLCRALIAAVDPYQSTIEVEPDVQFVEFPIDLIVRLTDVNGTNISRNIPEDCVPQILDLLNANVTFGTITSFEYDRDNSRFTAQISATEAGTGVVTVEFDGNSFQNVLNRDRDDLNTAFEINEVPYEFVGSLGGAERDANRRDEVDVAQTGG